jgi:hypothetical protein
MRVIVSDQQDRMVGTERVTTGAAFVDSQHSGFVVGKEGTRRLRTIAAGWLDTAAFIRSMRS